MSMLKYEQAAPEFPAAMGHISTVKTYTQEKLRLNPSNPATERSPCRHKMLHS